MLARMISRHTITIDQGGTSSSNVVQPLSFGYVQPSTSGGRGTSIGEDRPISHVPQSEPEFCTTCGQSCYGLGPRHGTSTMTGDQVRTLLKLYYCSIFYFSILYVTY